MSRAAILLIQSDFIIPCWRQCKATLSDYNLAYIDIKIVSYSFCAERKKIGNSFTMPLSNCRFTVKHGSC